MLDPYEIRKDFPILKRKVNDNPLIYFDNASTTQKPRQVINAIVDFYENHNANVHRAIHTLSQEASELYEKAHEDVAGLINSSGIEETIFLRGTTEAINLVAYAWGLHNLGKTDEVLISLMEHHSNMVPWELISRMKGFKIKYYPVKADGTLDYDAYESMISDKTRMVCVSRISNVTGVINDVKRIARVAHQHDALVTVDAAQAVPHLHVDVKDLDADFLAFSGHKMLGPTGIGVLYGKRDILEEMPPFEGGGEMIREMSYKSAEDRCSISWKEPPWKFEAGTPNVCGGIGLMAAVKYLKDIGLDNVEAHEKMLTKYALEHMREIKNLDIYGPVDVGGKCGIIPFGVKGLTSHDVALFLDAYGIMVRSGYHCAQPLHQMLKIASSARVSFYIYNTLEEIDKFVDVLKEIKGI